MKQSTILLSMALAALMSQPVLAKPGQDRQQEGPSHHGRFQNMTKEQRLEHRQAVQQKWDALTEAQRQDYINQAKNKLENTTNPKQDRRLIMMYSLYQNNPSMFDNPENFKGPHEGKQAYKDRARQGQGGHKNRQANKQQFEKAKQQWDALSEQEQSAFKQKIEARKELMESRKTEMMAKRLFARTLNNQ